MKLTIFKKMAFAFGTMAFLGACTSDFDNINTNPVASATMDAGILFTYNQVSVSGHTYEMWRGNVLHTSIWGQHLSTPWGTQGYLTNDTWGTAYWDMTYSKLVVNSQEIIRLTKDQATKNAMAKAWRAFIMHRLTDMWGDVPFTQAGNGISALNFTPKYDTQESIYKALLTDLKEAAATLKTAGNSYGAADLIYNGEHEKWRKFANTLRLRLALRLTKVDEALAKQHATEAIADGIIESHAETALMKHTKADTYHASSNGTSAPISDYGFGGAVMSSALVNAMKANNDPRLHIFGLPNAKGEYAGTPNGNVDVPRDRDVASYPNYNQGMPFAQDANAYFVSYAESMFLKAEAQQRGWVAGNASDSYEKGVRASLEQWGVKDKAAIDAFVNKVKYDASKGLEQIITQKWIGLYTDGFEAFAEVRRTGFPKFAASDINGNIPRRLKYPLSEQSLNKTSYSEATSRLQGGDVETARMWWDK